MERIRKAIQKQRKRKRVKEKVNKWLKNIMMGVLFAFLMGGLLIGVLIDEFIKNFNGNIHTVNVRHSEETVMNSAPPEAETLEFHHTIVLRTTGYCSCEKCCGWSTGITCSGTQATPRHTIGANLNQFPIGTVIVINGIEYVVEDTGSGIRTDHVDIFYETHEEALKHGVQYVDAYVKGE